jgi:hypothetical protein
MENASNLLTRYSGDPFTGDVQLQLRYKIQLPETIDWSNHLFSGKFVQTALCASKTGIEACLDF